MDVAHERERALEAILGRHPIETKLEALDALDRLALDPSGWFSDPILEKLFETRKLIIQSRFALAHVPLEEARNTIEAFIRAIKDKGQSDALSHAMAYLDQSVRVLSWLDQRPEE